MKNNKSTIFTLLLAVSALFFTSCNKWEDPDYKIPSFQLSGSDLRDLRPISYIIRLHTVGNAPDSIKPGLGRKNVYIQGYVVSSDETGNFFKSLVIQDKTGGIEVRIDKGSLFNDYPIGQKVYINCKDLVVGDYGGYPQLGVVYQTTQVGRINALMLKNIIFRDQLPNIDSMYSFLGGEYSTYKRPVKITSNGDLAANTGKLVMIPNCYFDAAAIGQPLSTEYSTTSRTVHFGTSSFELRTSNYADFRAIKCLNQPFTLYGIISIYNGTYQMTMRFASDLDYNNGGAMQTIKTFTFNENSLISEGWRVDNTSSTTKWSFVNYEGNKFMSHSQVTQSATCSDWLISPQISIGNMSEAFMILEHRINVEGSLQDYYQVYYSTTDNGINFNETQWNLLPSISLFPGASFSNSNPIDLSPVGNQSFRIAIRYNKYGSAPANRWEIKSVKLMK